MSKKTQVTVNIKGIVSSTSNKQGKIKVDNPTKSIYITVNEETAKKLESMNLQRYTSKEDKTDFFILKAGEGIKVYGSEGLQKVSTVASEENLNFHTDEKEVGISLLYAQTDKNAKGTYVRLTALNDPEDNIKFVEDINPFDMDEDDFDNLPF